MSGLASLKDTFAAAEVAENSARAELVPESGILVRFGKAYLTECEKRGGIWQLRVPYDVVHSEENQNCRNMMYFVDLQHYNAKNPSKKDPEKDKKKMSYFKKFLTDMEIELPDDVEDLGLAVQELEGRGAEANVVNTESKDGSGRVFTNIYFNKPADIAGLGEDPWSKE